MEKLQLLLTTLNKRLFENVLARPISLDLFFRSELSRYILHWIHVSMIPPYPTTRLGILAVGMVSKIGPISMPLFIFKVFILIHQLLRRLVPVVDDDGYDYAQQGQLTRMSDGRDLRERQEPTKSRKEE
eukprot:GHVN01080491.1.p1 GENE.GHVN01080491.1~~GHVN01080491.1.p1  ORF type:complete len:129 (-),score=16.69 GHVN01080491.1:216-602(-)